MLRQVALKDSESVAAAWIHVKIGLCTLGLDPMNVQTFFQVLEQIRKALLLFQAR